MTVKLFQGSAVALALSIGFVWATCRVQAQTTPDPAQAQRLKVLQSAGPAASITLVPVRVLGQPSRNVADALGLVLEKYGMENLDAMDAAFVPAEGTTWEEMPARFAEFLKENPTKSAYALYAEFLGDPRSGPTEVRWLAMDSSGALVLSDRQLPNDTDFKRIAARDPDPMGCSTLVAERLYSQLRWAKNAAAAKSEGKFARLWAEKSGTPNEAERKSMEQRSDKFKSSLKSAQVGVYSTRVNESTNADSAARLAKLVAERFGCRATAVEKALAIEIKPTSNQQKRLWDLARSFRENLRSNPPETDYSLLAEYLIDPSGAAHSVNFVVCDKSGDWVIVDFQNNQHDDFRRLTPRNVEDCERLTLERLAGLIR